MMFLREKLKILIALDGSIPGQAALMVIHPLVRSGPVECTLLHVAEPGIPGDGLEAHLELHRKAFESIGVPTRTRIVSGNPAEEILRQSHEGEFDLIAMSTHGRRGLDRVMMGSVAEEVVRRAEIPTLLCRMGTTALSWGQIVVALDGLPGAEEVLENAVFLAKRLGATIHLLKVGLNLLRSNSYRGVPLEDPEQAPTSYLENVAERLMSEGVRVITDRRSGLAATEIALFAKEIGAGLICMTTEGRPEEIPGLGRSVAAEVIRQAPCPVYIRRMTHTSCRPG
jgi:nucleotide-binding universal stress UspA family protein